MTEPAAPCACDDAAVAILTTVDDPADPRVDDYRDLTAADRRPDRPGAAAWSSPRAWSSCERMLDSPFPVRSLLGVPRRLAELDRSRRLDVPSYAADARRWPQSSAST